MVYVNPSPAPAYPFAAQRDSLRAALEAKCDSEREGASDQAAWLPECHWPTYFYDPRIEARLADVSGGWPEAQDALERELPEGFRAVVKLDVAWDGSISRARLVTYRGDLNSVDVAGLVKRLRLAHIGHFDFPTLEQTSVGVPLSGPAADVDGF